jgi:hypothetical protein
MIGVFWDWMTVPIKISVLCIPFGKNIRRESII